MPAPGVPLSTPALNATPLGSVPASLSVGVGEPDAVTVNVPGVPTENAVLLALVISGAVGLAEPKNTPLITAFKPPVKVTLICTFPEMFQTRYVPPVKLTILCVLSTLLGLFALTI